MPNHPTWLERIPELLGVLQREDAPVLLNRSAIEGLFGVRRRRAIALLHLCGGFRRRGVLVANLESVLAFLKEQQDKEAIEAALAQKESIAEALGLARQELTLPKIPLPPPAKLSEITFAGLPPGIHLSSGRLSVEFTTATELLEKLFTLAQAFANDFEHLEEALAHR